MSNYEGHTPGPWEFDNGNMGSCYGRPYYGIITNSDYSVFINVGSVSDDYRGNHGREEECEANARLIAAAPDLLAERDRLREALNKHREALNHALKGDMEPEDRAIIAQILADRAKKGVEDDTH